MKQLFLLLSLLLVTTFRVAANPPDEGMWLLTQITGATYEDMKRLGCKLTPEQILSINRSSLKDAIVKLDGGSCTAEMVSASGLVLTNHHCAYDAIQQHSAVGHNYLEDGFWAGSHAEEIHTPGSSASFLVRVEDVTMRITEAVEAVGDDMAGMARTETIDAIETEATDGNEYEAEVVPMFEGNQFLLFVYETFPDVRLVGAPPSSIGKFGGDTDNWMWPRHTGDFAVLRVYAGPDNKPAEYSENNVPYQPKHHLPVSMQGVEQGDYAMIMGYPGTTERYISAAELKHKYEHDNPTMIKLMGKRLEVMKEEMVKDEAVDIALASDYASLANYHKYLIGQSNGLRKSNLFQTKRATESQLKKWIGTNADRKAEYGDVLSGIDELVTSTSEVSRLATYLNFAGFAPEMVKRGFAYWRLHGAMEKAESEEDYAAMLTGMSAAAQAHFAESYDMVDRKILAAMAQFLHEDLGKDAPDVFRGKTFLKFDGPNRYQDYADYVFERSILTNQSKSEAFFAKPKLKTLQKDPGVEYVISVVNLFLTKVNPTMAAVGANGAELSRKYVKGLLEMNSDKTYYPDANSTMRLTYGTVIPYQPRDGVSYHYYTTTDGIWEKEDPNDEEFKVPSQLMKLIKNKDFGRYADKSGEMRVCFLTNNDITGGNSGSPVINARGELIGIAFDGNWESMTSDLVFEDDVVRTISVDIRYVLWVIDKFAGAKHLVDEMTIVSGS